MNERDQQAINKVNEWIKNGDKVFCFVSPSTNLALIMELEIKKKIAITNNIIFVESECIEKNRMIFQNESEFKIDINDLKIETR